MIIIDETKYVTVDITINVCSIKNKFPHYSCSSASTLPD